MASVAHRLLAFLPLGTPQVWVHGRRKLREQGWPAEMPSNWSQRFCFRLFSRPARARASNQIPTPIPDNCGICRR